MLKAAVFDMDGLMFDTETLVYRIWQRMMDEEGYPYSLEDFKQTVGKRIFPRSAVSATCGISGKTAFPSRRVCSSCWIS